MFSDPKRKYYDSRIPTERGHTLFHRSAVIQDQEGQQPAFPDQHGFRNNPQSNPARYGDVDYRSTDFSFERHKRQWSVPWVPNSLILKSKGVINVFDYSLTEPVLSDTHFDQYGSPWGETVSPSPYAPTPREYYKRVGYHLMNSKGAYNKYAIAKFNYEYYNQNPGDYVPYTEAPNKPMKRGVHTDQPLLPSRIIEQRPKMIKPFFPHYEGIGASG